MRPRIVRGLVMTERSQGAACVGRAIRRRLAVRRAQPDFIAYDVRSLPSALPAALRLPGPAGAELDGAHAAATALTVAAPCRSADLRAGGMSESDRARRRRDRRDRGRRIGTPARAPTIPSSATPSSPRSRIRAAPSRAPAGSRCRSSIDGADGRPAGDRCPPMPRATARANMSSIRAGRTRGSAPAAPIIPSSRSRCRSRRCRARACCCAIRPSRPR